MKMFIIDQLSDRVVITCIQKVNKNNRRSKFKTERTYGLLQGVINGTVRKQAQMSSTDTLNY